jgi:hypothetical protein
MKIQGTPIIQSKGNRVILFSAYVTVFAGVSWEDWWTYDGISGKDSLLCV